MEGQMITESLEDGSVRCSMIIDGISATTTVSSMHLVPDKERQLRSYSQGCTRSFPHRPERHVCIKKGALRPLTY